MYRQLIVAVVGASFVVGCSKSEKAVPERSPSVALASVPPPAPKAPEPPTLVQRLMAKKELWQAISITKPHYDDGGLVPGAAALAVWGTSNMKWPEIKALPETKFALVMKDSEAERGKQICASGTIVEITVDRSSGQPIYMGGLVTPGMKILRFAAVGSTGELVQNSIGAFCGVVIGRESYANSAGGTSHAVFAVGMFDLPENKVTGKSVAAVE